MVEIKNSRKPGSLISLFSGAGGLDLGFRQAGFDIALAVDADHAATATYKHNIGERDEFDIDNSVSTEVVEHELTGRSAKIILDRMPHDVVPTGIIGGPPCQAFSAGNVRQSPSDPRAQMPIVFGELIAELTERYPVEFVVFENVPGLRRKQNAAVVTKLLTTLNSAGYEVFSTVLDASRFDVPQFRRRAFVVGINRTVHKGLEFEFPSGNDEVSTVEAAIRGPAFSNPVFFNRAYSPEQIAELAGHRNHWTMQPRSKRFFDGSLLNGRGNGKGRSFRVLKWDRPSPTVAYGHREIHIHPSGKRRLTIFEALTLQGFPDWFELVGNFSSQSRLVSDSVPPPLARALADAIRCQLEL